MLKGAALLYSIVISFIITILLSAVILLSYFNKLYIITTEQNQKLISNSTSGVNFLLSTQDDIRLGENRIVDLFKSTEDSVYLERKSWGVFEIIQSRAFQKKFSKSQIAFVGNKWDSDRAIYLADRNKPLNVCGHSFLRGNCLLPKQGIKSGTIEGQTFSGDKLIEGNVSLSNTELPQVDSVIFKTLTEYRSKTLKKDSVLLWANVRDTIKNSFSSPTMFIVGDELNINNEKIKGNVVITARKSIVVSKDAILEDVILCAPKITFSEGFVGELQAFATDTILVEKKCRFNYPSALSIITENFNPSLTPWLKISEDVNFCGNLLECDKFFQTGKQNLITISKGALVKGIVYSNGLIELLGTVHGSIYANSFVVFTPSAVYEDYLLNATVDVNGLSRFFVSGSFIKQNRKKEIIKWLN